ncbi:MAG: carboxypeptidase-like regulatory domain-containing protein [Vicinamibacterales bacterium]
MKPTLTLSSRTVAYLTLVFLLAAGVGAFAQSAPAKITGRVTDGSGAALPGVTVTISSVNLKTPATAITDGSGQYLSMPLPPDRYAITFELAGFESRANAAVALRPGELFILDRELAVASVKETVEVVAPVLAPPTPPRPRPETPKRPVPKPVSPALLASVCGPGQPGSANLALGTIVAHRDEANRKLYGNNDTLVIDVGSNVGVSRGQNFVVRRRFRADDKSAPLKYATFGEEAAGLIQVIETRPENSDVVVVYACGEFMAGDSIEPFDAMPMWTSLDPGKPQFDDPAKVILGEHGKTLGSARDLMVIDRGTSQGVQRGQHITIFRRSLGERGPVSTIAEAIIIAVRADSATIRIQRANDAVSVGDLAALHR